MVNAKLAVPVRKLLHSLSLWAGLCPHITQRGKIMETRKEKIIWCFRKARFPGGKRLSSRWLL